MEYTTELRPYIVHDLFIICLLSPEQPQAPGPLTAAVTYPQAHALAHTHT